MDDPDDVTIGHLVAGTVGFSLLRDWYRSGIINETRLSELASILERSDRAPYAVKLNPSHQELDAGYAEWATQYDGPNPMILTEESVVHPILKELAGPGVRALDAACGTGRHARYLFELGCETSACDQSVAMLQEARNSSSEISFESADVRHLPFEDESFDLATVALALCHLEDPCTAIVELTRVLRPGGTLVISDPHTSSLAVGGQAFYRGDPSQSELSWVRNHFHSASVWLRAFRIAGLEVVDCIEPPYSDAHVASSPAASEFPEATEAVFEGLPSLWVWVLRR